MSGAMLFIELLYSLSSLNSRLMAVQHSFWFQSKNLMVYLCNENIHKNLKQWVMNMYLAGNMYLENIYPEQNLFEIIRNI